MNTKIIKIVEELKMLTLLEAAQLVSEIEKAFNVNASFGPALVNAHKAEPSQEAIETPEERTNFDLILSEVPAEKKIAILKIVRNVTGLGLKESKDIVDNVPKTLKESLAIDECNLIKKELEAAGAKVVLK